MDIFMVGTWMVYSQNASTIIIDIIMVGPWMFSSQNTIDHGRHLGFEPWTSSYHGGPWMLYHNNSLSCGRYHG